MTISFDHLGIISGTVDENVAIGRFFSDVLGLDVDGDPSGGYAEVKAGAITIALHHGAMIDEVAPHGGTLLQFKSSDVHADIEAIRSRGGTIALEPTSTDWGTVSAYVAGPHNLLVELYEWRTN